MKKFILLLAFISSIASAVVPSGNIEEFCSDRSNPSFVKDLARDHFNLMSFSNRGGIRNGGVCWWHSRFQRNALYLTIFDPSLPKPETSEAVSLIRKIRNANEVVTIPGFRNFGDFTSYYQSEIQAELEAWQRFEGLRFTWIRGLRGSSSVSSEFMKTLMDNLYEEVETKNNIGYQKLQMDGLTAHAWLVIGMKKTEKGYDLEVIDSNDPRYVKTYHYLTGDTALLYQEAGLFTPYLENTHEMERLNSVIKSTCTKAGN